MEKKCRRFVDAIFGAHNLFEYRNFSNKNYTEIHSWEISYFLTNCGLVYITGFQGINSYLSNGDCRSPEARPHETTMPTLQLSKNITVALSMRIALHNLIKQCRADVGRSITREFLYYGRIFLFTVKCELSAPPRKCHYDAYR